jgi:dTDP-4-amino-4,6-dideoxygalactose transaminase
VFGDEERAEVLAVLATGHLSRYGDLDDPNFTHKVYDLEQAFAQYCGSRHALATSSGTASLLISLLALGLQEGDEVLVPGFTYVATYAAIIHARAVPVLVEVDESLTIDPVDLQCKITPKTKAILAVHMLGNPCDMAAITALAAEHGLLIIEDACQAAGAKFRGKPVGTFGAFGAFSLNRYKMISAGEGGLLLTDDDDLYERAFALHDQGHKPTRATKTAPGQTLIGLNFKMNEITGAIALAQLRKLDDLLATLRRNKQRLRASIPDLPGVGYRRLNDPVGECATLLTVTFDDVREADGVAAKLGGTTLAASGWHHYRHMSHVAWHSTPSARWSPPARYAAPGDLRRTEDLLARSINISVGVVDPGLSASFGVDVTADAQQIDAVVERFVDAVRSCSR